MTELGQPAAPALGRQRAIGVLCGLSSVLLFSSFTLASRLGFSSSLTLPDIAALRFGIGGMLMYLLTVGSAAAGSVVKERQQQTLESLLTIPVERRAIRLEAVDRFRERGLGERLDRRVERRVHAETLDLEIVGRIVARELGTDELEETRVVRARAAAPATSTLPAETGATA